MTWTAIKYVTTITIATGGEGNGPVVVPFDQDVTGTYAYLDKFVDSFNRQFLDYGNDIDSSISIAKNSINNYICNVRLFGYRNDAQGERFFYGWSNVAVGDVEISTNTRGFSSYEFASEKGPTLSYHLVFDDAAYNYYGMPQYFWMLKDLGKSIWSFASDVFDFNKADVREYLSNQSLFDLLSGSDIAYLPDTIEAANTWNYNTIVSNVDPGGYGPSVVRGGSGNDSVYGGQFIDWIYGDDGNDVLFGGGAADHLVGGGWRRFIVWR